MVNERLLRFWDTIKRYIEIHLQLTYDVFQQYKFHLHVGVYVTNSTPLCSHKLY